MKTKSSLCEAFNRKFDPEAPDAKESKNYYGHNLNTWNASSFIASELLTADVVAAFAEKHLEPQIDWEKTADGGVISVVVQARMTESHPLFSPHLNKNAIAASARVFEIRKKRGRDNRMYSCNCKPAEESIMESGLKRGMDERETLRTEILNFLDTAIQRRVARGYQDIQFVDEILRRIGNDEDAERFVRILERPLGSGGNVFGITRYAFKGADGIKTPDSIYNEVLRAELIETYRRYKDASGEETP